MLMAGGHRARAVLVGGPGRTSSRHAAVAARSCAEFGDDDLLVVAADPRACARVGPWTSCCPPVLARTTSTTTPKPQTTNTQPTAMLPTAAAITKTTEQL